MWVKSHLYHLVACGRTCSPYSITFLCHALKNSQGKAHIKKEREKKNKRKISEYADWLTHKEKAIKLTGNTSEYMEERSIMVWVIFSQ